MANPTATSRILELSRLISSSTQKIHDILIAANLPLPSFETDATLTLPTELDSARDTLLDATSELHDLLFGFQNILSQYGSVRPHGWLDPLQLQDHQVLHAENLCIGF